MSTSSVAVPLLPPAARPRLRPSSVKLLSMKKRPPQSIMSLSLSPLRKNRFLEEEGQGQETHSEGKQDQQKRNQHQHQHQQKRTKVKSNDLDLPVWILGDSIDCLLTLPLFHVSPMTHLVIPSSTSTNAITSSAGGSSNSANTSNVNSNSNISPNRIASRIVQCIRSMDVTCEYNSERANATVQTRDRAVLSIQLFKTPDSRKIVLDIERKSGDTITFHSVASTILSETTKLIGEIEDCNSNNNSNNIRNRQSNYNDGHVNVDTWEDNSNGNHHQHESHEEEDHRQAMAEITVTAAISSSSSSSSQLALPLFDESNVLKFEEAMDRICDLLRKDRMDCVVLGMESLSFLTDGKSSNEEITHQAVHAVLLNDNEDGPGAGEWKDILLGYLCTSNPDGERETITQLMTSNTALGNNDRKGLLMKYDDQIKHLALKVVSNCFTFIMNKNSKDMVEILRNKNCNPRLKDILLLLVEQTCRNKDHHYGDIWHLFNMCASVNPTVSNSHDVCKK